MIGPIRSSTREISRRPLSPRSRPRNSAPWRGIRRSFQGTGRASLPAISPRRRGLNGSRQHFRPPRPISRPRQPGPTRNHPSRRSGNLPLQAHRGRSTISVDCSRMTRRSPPDCFRTRSDQTQVQRGRSEANSCPTAVRPRRRRCRACPAPRLRRDGRHRSSHRPGNSPSERRRLTIGQTRSPVCRRLTTWAACSRVIHRSPTDCFRTGSIRIRARSRALQADPFLPGGPVTSAPAPVTPATSGWPAAQSFLQPLPPLPNPFAKAGPASDSSSDLNSGPTTGGTTPMAPPRSVLFKQPQPDWDFGSALIARQRDAAAFDAGAQELGRGELPRSKSGAPYTPPSLSSAPLLSFELPQWLDIAHWLSPNLVDYFTKTLPPPPPFPPTPGKIPSLNNPYAGPAALEAATWLLAPLEGRVAAALEPAASAVERSAAEALLQAARSAASAKCWPDPSSKFWRGRMAS